MKDTIFIIGLIFFFGYNECEGGNNVYDSDNTIAAYI